LRRKRIRAQIQNDRDQFQRLIVRSPTQDQEVLKRALLQGDSALTKGALPTGSSLVHSLT
jgi:hypothetical protein